MGNEACPQGEGEAACLQAGNVDDTQSVDWSCPDQVASHVSRSTLAGMQQQWRTHAAAMDAQGRSFAEKIFSLHAHALKELANMKTFEIKPVTALLNTFTAGVREQVLSTFQVLRQADDAFAQSMYQLTRTAFTRNLREGLDAKDAACTDKVRRLQVQHEQALATQRAAAAVQRQQDSVAMHEEISRTLRAENRRKLAEVINGITAQFNQQLASMQAAASGATATPGATPAFAAPGAGAGQLDAGGAPGTAGSLHESSQPSPAAGAGGVAASSGPTIAAAGAGALPTASGVVLGGGGGPGGAITLEMLQALAHQDEDAVGSVLARKEMEASVRAANQQVEELASKVEELTLALQQQHAEQEAWKEKWSLESAKTEGIKRECLQVIIKCEKRVRALQEEHLQELGKRDAIMGRSKDTILRLEARLAELAGQPTPQPSLAVYHQPAAAAAGPGALASRNHGPSPEPGADKQAPLLLVPTKRSLHPAGGGPAAASVPPSQEPSLAFAGA